MSGVQAPGLTLVGVFFTVRQRAGPLLQTTRALLSERGAGVEDARVVVREPDGSALFLDERHVTDYTEFWRALIREFNPGSAPSSSRCHARAMAVTACVEPMGLGLAGALPRYVSSMLQPAGVAVFLLLRGRGTPSLRNTLARCEGYVLRLRIRGFVMAQIVSVREKRWTSWVHTVRGAARGTTTARLEHAFSGPRGLASRCIPSKTHGKECRP